MNGRIIDRELRRILANVHEGNVLRSMASIHALGIGALAAVTLVQGTLAEKRRLAVRTTRLHDWRRNSRPNIYGEIWRDER
jgi:hypothetical protein